MSLGWKRFSFFETEERRGVEVPVDSTCSSGSADHLVLGCSDGQARTQLPWQQSIKTGLHACTMFLDLYFLPCAPGKGPHQ